MYSKDIIETADFYSLRSKLYGVRVSPAMESGLMDRGMSFEDLVAIIDEVTPKPGPRGPYKKRTPASRRG